MFSDPCRCFLLFAKCFVYFLLCAQLVLTHVPLIAIRFNATIASFARDPRFEASGEWGKSNGWSGIRKFEELDAIRRSRPIKRGSVFRTLSQLVVFASIPCPIAVTRMVHVETIVHRIFRLRRSECFKHVWWRIQVSRWYVLRTTQNGDFVWLPLCVALRWRLAGAVALGWRSGARACCPFLGFSPCAHARFC